MDRRRFGVLLAAATLALNVPFAIAYPQGKSHGKGEDHGNGHGNPHGNGNDEGRGNGNDEGRGNGNDEGRGNGNDEGRGNGNPHGNGEGNESHGNASHGRKQYFRQQDYNQLRQYYDGPRNLPPGLRKKYYRTGTLPPGWQQDFRPMPAALVQQLPPIPSYYQRGYMNGYALVINPRTRVIVDAVDIVGALAGR